MKIKFKNDLFDCIIEDEQIILQGLHMDVIFPDAYKRLKSEAIDAFYSVEYAGERFSSFIPNYISDAVQYYIDVNPEEAVIEEHFIN